MLRTSAVIKNLLSECFYEPVATRSVSVKESQ